jgi:ribosomal protein S18 acetylase RimI-like enzyme
MPSEIDVRPFQPSDRSQVRAICHVTGFMGEPADWYWRDAESFAEVWTGHYTDREPESAFVAVRSGRVVGYLLGCVDTARAPSPAAAVTRQMFRRGLWLRPGTAGFFWRSIADVLRGTAVPAADLPRWPSHLHIDLLAEARGRGAGAALMRAWQGRLATVRSPGCHLTTLAENAGGIAFFERMGFRRHGPPARVPGLRTRAGARMHQQIMVRDG